MRLHWRSTLSPYLSNQPLVNGEAIATSLAQKEVSATEKSWQVRWWQGGSTELVATSVDSTKVRTAREPIKSGLVSAPLGYYWWCALHQGSTLWF